MCVVWLTGCVTCRLSTRVSTVTSRASSARLDSRGFETSSVLSARVSRSTASANPPRRLCHASLRVDSPGLSHHPRGPRGRRRRPLSAGTRLPLAQPVDRTLVGTISPSFSPPRNFPQHPCTLFCHYSFWCIRDLGFGGLEASLLIFRILKVFIPYFLQDLMHIPYFFRILIVCPYFPIIFIPNFFKNLTIALAYRPSLIQHNECTFQRSENGLFKRNTIID